MGALNVLRGFPTFLNGLHIATGSAVWAGMVVFSVLSMQYVRLSPLRAKIVLRAPARRPMAALADYFALTKPIIMLLLLMTTVGAMIVAGHGWPPVDLLLWTLLGGALASGGASALNQVIDRELDQNMARTARRPLAAGRIDTAGGLAFGLVLSVASFYVLAVFVNPLSAVLALFGNIYYVLGYSLLLKKSSVQNIVIGGGAGAVPPLVGWAAATGTHWISGAVPVCAGVLLDPAAFLGAGAVEKERLCARAGADAAGHLGRAGYPAADPAVHPAGGGAVAAADPGARGGLRLPRRRGGAGRGLYRVCGAAAAARRQQGGLAAL